MSDTPIYNADSLSLQTTTLLLLPYTITDIPRAGLSRHHRRDFFLGLPTAMLEDLIERIGVAKDTRLRA